MNARIMLKYLFSISLAFVLFACGSDDATERSPEDMPAEEPQVETQADQSEIAEVTDEELEKFATVMLKAEIQRIGTRSELRSLLEELDLSMMRFEEIEAASQRDGDLRQRRSEMKRELRGTITE